MKNCFLCTLISVSLIVSFAKADDHETFTGGLDPNAPINVQAQVCTLKPGKTQAQYDRLVNKYFEWAKKYPLVWMDMPLTWERRKKNKTQC